MVDVARTIGLQWHVYSDEPCSGTGYEATYQPSGAVILGGSALVPSRGYGTSGGITFGGTAVPMEPSDVYSPTGGIVVSGTSALGFGVAQKFTWNVEQILILPQTFTWNHGSGRFFVYRVEGRCKTAGNPPLDPGDELCVGAWGRLSYVTNIVGRDVGDVCRQLRARNWVWPIESIKRFSLPLFKSDLLPGENPQNNTLVPVELLGEDCTELVIDFNAELNLEVSTAVTEL
jgi:hypothetical protein